MAGLMRRDPFEVLEPFRRLLEGGDLQAATPRVEEFREGSTAVIRAELPGIDPEADVELTVVDDTLRLRAERRERSEPTPSASAANSVVPGVASAASTLR